MSWEYSINLDSEEAVSSVVTDLKNCELFSSSTTDYIDWKNPKSIDDILIRCQILYRQEKNYLHCYK